MFSLAHPLFVAAVQREVRLRLDARGLAVTTLPPMEFAALVGDAHFDLVGGRTVTSRIARQAYVEQQIGAGIMPTLESIVELGPRIIIIDAVHAA